MITKEKYRKKIEKMKRKLQSEIAEWNKQVCIANNPYKVGDKFTDHMGSIIIEKITCSYSAGWGLPCCVYFGSELKKDGTPKANKNKRNAWQSNDIKLQNKTT